MPKGIPLKQYSGEFKQQAIEDMRENNLSQYEAASKYNVSRSMLQRWERIYLENGAEGLYVERRGRARKSDSVHKGRPGKLKTQVEEDLIAENQRLRMEVDYLKKLNALVQARELQERKRK